MAAKRLKLILVSFLILYYLFIANRPTQAQYNGSGSCYANGWAAISCNNDICSPNAGLCCSGYVSGDYCADNPNNPTATPADPNAGCTALYGTVFNDQNRNTVFDQSYAYVNGVYTYVGESGWGAGVKIDVFPIGSFYTDANGYWTTGPLCYTGNVTVVINTPQNSIFDATRMWISPSGNFDQFQTNYNSSSITFPWSGNSNNNLQFGLYPDNWPHLDNTSISPKPVSPNGQSQYVITVQASDADGASDIGSMYAWINLQNSDGSAHTPFSDYRGYLGWSTPSQNFPYWCGSAQCSSLTNYASYVNDTSGGGAACALYNGYGNQYINLISCTSRISGNIRYIDFVVTFNNNFTSPLTGNTISGWADDINGPFPTAWWVYDNFNLTFPPATCSNATPDGQEIPATTTAYTVSANGVSNAQQVYFAIWTDVNGQDDLVWYAGTNQGGGTWTATINPSAHAGNGLVNVHAYLVNGAGTFYFCDTANFIKNVPPVLGNVTISPKPIIANGVSQYTIAMTSTDENGGGDITNQYAFININLSSSNYRGYMGWSSNGFSWWGGDYKSGSPQACTGGGQFGLVGNPYWGSQYINIVPGTCTTSVSGNQRTVTFNITFNGQYYTDGPISGNTLSGFVSDAGTPPNALYDGWRQTDTFDLGVPSGTITASPNPCQITSGNIYCNSVITWNTVNSPTAAVTVQDTGVGGSEVLYGVAPAASTNAPWIAASPHSYIFRLYNNGAGSILLASVVVTGIQTQTLTGHLYVDPGNNTCTTLFNGGSPKVQVYTSGVPGSSENVVGGVYTVNTSTGDSAVLSGTPGGYYVVKVNKNGAGFVNYSSFTYTPINMASNTTLDWCIKNTGGNIGIVGGDVREVNLSDPIPPGGSASLGNNAFFSSAAGSTANFGGGTPPTWVINGEFGYNDDPKNKNGLFSYSFFMNRATVKQVTVNNFPGCPTGGAACTSALSTIASSGIYHTDGDLTINSWNHSAGAHILLLVNGNLYIKGNIKIPSGAGSLFIAAAKGNIYVDPAVGLASPNPTLCTDSSCTSVEGIYTAESSIYIQSADNGCATGVSDKQLNFAGNFVTNSKKPFKVSGPGKFVMSRSLCTNDSVYPALTIQPRYDFIPQLTDFYKIPSVRWKEVNP